MSMNACPAELLAQIIKWVPTNKELRILRAVDKTFCALATPLAFRRVYVRNRLPSALDLQALMERDELAKVVETIVFRWARTPSITEGESTRRATRVALEAVFTQLHRFPALVGIELNLCPDMFPEPLIADENGNIDLERNPSEPGSVEVTLVQAILRATDRPRLKSLTLANLLAYPHLHYKSEEFVGLLSSLEHLHIGFHGLCSVRGPNGAYSGLIVPLWQDVIPGYFLRPTQARLTSLTLMSDQPVGRSPNVDLSQLFFPNLRYLELGAIMFDNRRHTENFIVQHGRTLRTLVLDSCPMHVRLLQDPPRPWRDVCDRFAEALEVLVDVQFHVREGWGLDNRKRTGEVRLYYTIAETGSGGDRGWDTRQYEPADRPAIERLLAKVEERRLHCSL
ncbi:hypothetical protein GY45DRAFT_1322127 [Cubamyces sp. BRFM 1775]|nr:hypothetical protein GY45DRAFT_1322127 [Cubamyces sp. BRFM 1775]